jgi:hypothetical protein
LEESGLEFLGRPTLSLRSQEMLSGNSRKSKTRPCLGLRPGQTARSMLRQYKGQGLLRDAAI